MQRASSLSFPGLFSSFKIEGSSVYQQESHYITREYSCLNSHPGFHGNTAWWGGSELAGSSSTMLGEKTASLLGEKTASFSKNAQF